jgi:hypothetical protein
VTKRARDPRIGGRDLFESSHTESEQLSGFTVAMLVEKRDA